MTDRSFRLLSRQRRHGAHLRGALGHSHRTAEGRHRQHGIDALTLQQCLRMRRRQHPGVGIDIGQINDWTAISVIESIAAVPALQGLHHSQIADAKAAANALPATVLLASFIGTGSSFLAFAIVAAQRGLTSTALPDKSFYFLGGLTEATETLAAFVAMCLWPSWFPQIAYGFAALCALTTALRIVWGCRRFR